MVNAFIAFPQIAMVQMPNLNLRNVEVKFPYPPYDLQKNMMTAMIDSAQQVQRGNRSLYSLNS